MPNMGYCRFRNTLSDLRDCYDHMSDELGPEEEQARQRLIALCCDIAADEGWEEP